MAKRVGKYRAVPAAEAYKRDGENRPVCECGCGEPKVWNSTSRIRNGGWYKCPVKRRESVSRYRQSDKGREVSARWRRSDRGRESSARAGAKRYYRLKEAGWCVDCGEGVLALSESLCWPCLNKKEERDMRIY